MVARLDSPAGDASRGAYARFAGLMYLIVLG